MSFTNSTFFVEQGYAYLASKHDLRAEPLILVCLTYLDKKAWRVRFVNNLLILGLSTRVMHCFP